MGTDGEDEVNPAPVTINLDITESAPAETFSTVTPWSWLVGILVEEESNVKDSLTSGLPSKRPNVSGEASGSGEQPMLLVMGESKVYARDGANIVIEKKTAFVANKTGEKGGMSMGPIVMSRWKSKDYSAPIEETISMVDKSMGMLEATSGGFAPQTTGVGQMKLEAPLQYSGKRQPRVRKSS